jgi:hypothetical protein
VSSSSLKESLASSPEPTSRSPTERADQWLDRRLGRQVELFIAPSGSFFTNSRSSTRTRPLLVSAESSFALSPEKLLGRRETRPPRSPQDQARPCHRPSCLFSFVVSSLQAAACGPARSEPRHPRRTGHSPLRRPRFANRLHNWSWRPMITRVIGGPQAPVAGSGRRSRHERC